MGAVSSIPVGSRQRGSQGRAQGCSGLNPSLVVQIPLIRGACVAVPDPTDDAVDDQRRDGEGHQHVEHEAHQATTTTMAMCAAT